jgi:FKBP-type peptidyl-prolyl cis-trans isomerase FklB
MEAQNNKRLGDAFLAGNGKKKGVVTLPSGLQYEILKAGNGKRAKDADKVECNYRGTLINGTEFVDTFVTNQPVILSVEEGGGIPGLSEALKLMPAGSTWRLFIPPQLAYAERGHGREIGPNEVLIIEVELLAIQ